MLNSPQPDAVRIAPTASAGLSGEDGDLLRRARAGEAGAFCELARSFEARLRRQALALCGDASMADDLAQETLVEVWKGLRQFHGRCQLFTWICAIMLNRYRSWRRRQRWLAFGMLGDTQRAIIQQHLAGIPDEGAVPDTAADQAERSISMRRALDALPHRHRVVIYLRFYEGSSLEEMSCALGISVGTVKSRLFHGLEKMRKMNLVKEEA